MACVAVLPVGAACCGAGAAAVGATGSSNGRWSGTCGSSPLAAVVGSAAAVAVVVVEVRCWQCLHGAHDRWVQQQRMGVFALLLLQVFVHVRRGW